VLAVGSWMSVATTAEAKPLHEAFDQMTGCRNSWGDISQWTPAAGPAASFIADTYAREGGLMWIALGYDTTGFWSAEGYDPDACDDCSGFSLVHTTFAGKRTSHKVADHQLSEKHRDDPKAYRKAIKARLFSLAAGPWNVGTLSHDYKLVLPKHAADGTIAKYTGWMAHVEKKDAFALRFGPVGLPHMCWCDQTWRGYALAKPK
jgi:hypothetical protein